MTSANGTPTETMKLSGQKKKRKPITKLNKRININSID